MAEEIEPITDMDAVYEEAGKAFMADPPIDLSGETEGEDDEPAPEAAAKADEPAEAEDSADDEPAAAKNEDFKPSEERQKESVDSMWAELRRRKKETKRARAELDQQRAQLEQQRAEVAKQQELAELMRSNPREGFNRYAQANGLDPVGFYKELTEAHMSEGGEAPAAVKRQIDELRQQQEQWRKQQEDAQRQASVEQQRAQLRSKIQEIGSIREHDSLRKMNPYLAAMPQAKFDEEVHNCVIYLAQHEPEALHDTVALVKRLEQAAGEEYSQWANAYKALHQANSEPAKSGDPGKVSPAPSAKSPRAADNASTLTNADESAHGGARELSDEERYERAGKFFLKQMREA